MIENKYKGPESIDYKKADLSELKYIKIIYTDVANENHEIKTEVNFLSDNYLSLFIKKQIKNKENNGGEKEPSEENSDLDDTSQNNAYYDDYLKKLAEIKALKEKAGTTVILPNIIKNCLNCSRQI